MASPDFPEPPPALDPTPLDDVDAAVKRLNDKKEAWVRVSIPERIEFLRRCLDGVLEVADEWVAAACRAKGIDPESATAGEEWLGGPMTTARNLRLLIESLEAGGRPEPPKRWTRHDGQELFQVFPAGLMDRLTFPGFVGEVWIEPGAPATQGKIYRDKEAGQYAPGKVALVLGAGNVASIGPMDALYKLFVEDEVVLLKTNPVNAYLGPFYERAFHALIEAGYFAVVHGGAEVGKHLTAHTDIDTIHITGSDRTHDAIVWGTDPEEAARRKREGEPLCDKPISSELGCVTPVFIVPGPWTESEMDYQARHVASMVANNGSFNCNAAKVLVLARGWPQREAFLGKVHRALAAIPPRKAYYPGARERYRRFLEEYPDAKPLGEESEQVVPWTIIPNVAPEEGEYALTNEAFCGVLAEVSLEASSAPEYLERAVDFANDVLWGTLSCMLLVHPTTEGEHGEELERALTELRYGGIGVNVWAAVLYGLVTTTWGAFPGHTLEDIRSGRGVVHNTYMFDHPERSVVRAPFIIRPTPAWFADHATLAELGRKLTWFESDLSIRRLPGIVYTAMRG